MDYETDSNRIAELKKFKKKGMIKIILSCEDEIDLLNQQLEEDKPIIVLEDVINSKMTEYLKERIRIIQEPERRDIYLRELKRLNDAIDD